MKCFTRGVALCLLVAVATGGAVRAVNFSSQQSSITVYDGAKLNIANSLSNVGGTLNVTPSGHLAGPVSFSTGLLNTQFGQKGGVEITGSYNVDNSGNITLDDGFLNAQSYAELGKVTVSGTSRIEGQPLLMGAIELADADAVLYLGVQSALSQSINLNGGSLYLVDDLNMASGAQIVGPGTVYGQGRTINVPLSEWSSNLTFSNVTINMPDGLIVTGTWTFGAGVSMLTGAGTELALQLKQSTGSLIANGGQVAIIGLEVAGNIKTGSGLVLRDQNSSFFFGNCTVWFAGDTAFSTGSIIIGNPCTWMLGGHNVSFTNKSANTAANGNLTGAGLAVYDELTVNASATQEGIPAVTPGTISAATTFFSNGVFSSAAIDQCLASGVLGVQTLANSGPTGGTAALFVSATSAQASDAALAILASGNVAANQVIELTQGEAAVTHAAPISINASGIVLDGNGGTLKFAGPVGSINANTGVSAGGTLFNVATGASITLQNITLYNVTQDTFGLGASSVKSPAGGVINFGQNVTLVLGDDVILTTGTINITGTNSVLTVCGLNGRRILALQPTNKAQASIVNLGSGSLALQSAELVGLRYVASGSTAASIALAGDAVANVGASTGINFDVEGEGNEIVMLKDSLVLSGSISFPGLAANNSLAIRFAIPSILPSRTLDGTLVAGLVPATPPVVVGAGIPVVVLNGSAVVAGNATAGSFADLSFPDPSVVVYNGLGSNVSALTIGANSSLTGNVIDIEGHKITRTSSIYSQNAQVKGLGISAAPAGKGTARAAVTTFGRSREAQRARLSNAAASTGGVIAHSGPSKEELSGAARERARKSKLQKRSIELDDPSLLTRGGKVRGAAKNSLNSSGKKLAGLLQKAKDAITKTDRSLDANAYLPTSFAQVVRQGNDVNADDPVAGNIEYDGGANLRFFTSDKPYNILLKNGYLVQKPGTNLTLGADQYINIDGNCTIVLNSGAFDINPDHLNFVGEQASLTIVFAPADAVRPPVVNIVPMDDTFPLLNIGNGSSLTFSGNGRVLLEGLIILGLTGSSTGKSSLNFFNGADLIIGGFGVIYGAGSFNTVASDIDVRGSIFGAVGLSLDDNFRFSMRGGNLFLNAALAVVEGGMYDISFNGTSVYLMEGSTLALNDYLLSPLSLALQNFTVQDTFLSVDQDSRVTLGENGVDSQGHSQLTQCNVVGLQVEGVKDRGAGTFGYHARGLQGILPSRGFEARFIDSFEKHVIPQAASRTTLLGFLAPFVSQDGAGVLAGADVLLLTGPAGDNFLYFTQTGKRYDLSSTQQPTGYTRSLGVLTVTVADSATGGSVQVSENSGVQSTFGSVI